MLCDNCGKREANIRYSENINGRKRNLNLCQECSERLGIEKMSFTMPINFSSFLGGFLDEFEDTEFMPLLEEIKTLKCKSCGYTFDDIANTGRLGCEECYNTFESRLDPIIKKIQGNNKHIGRVSKKTDRKIESHNIDAPKKEDTEINKLQEELKQAIKDERYEDAAKIRDKIKKIEK